MCKDSFFYRKVADFRIKSYICKDEKYLNDFEAAEKTIEMLEDFFHITLGLNKRLSEVGIDDRNFSLMAEKACRGTVLKGFTELDCEDIEKIFKMCK